MADEPPARTPDDYRHTQIGWVIVVTMVVVGAVATVPMATAGLGTMATIIGGTLLALVVVFGTLTVTVDADALAWSFGVGIIRKRVALADVRTFRAVKNPWYYGWGIRITPHGVLYNVSGLGAVEIGLRSGKRLRVGTDEPEALERALLERLGEPEPLTAEESAEQSKSHRRLVVVILASVVVVVIGLAVLFSLQMRPPTVTITRDTVSVQGLVYGADVPLADVTDVSLERRLPTIQLRTNGFALSGTLRGHFRTKELGDGQLFVEARVPPYVLVRTRNDFVIVNFEDPERTRTVYDELRRARRD